MTSERHVGIDALTIPMGDGTELVIAPHRNVVERVPAPIAEALRRCNELASLETHSTRLPPGLGRAVPLLHRGGLLLSEGALARLCAAPEPEPMESIASIGFVTRDRLPTLCRALGSFAAHLRQHARAPELVVLDGSRRERPVGGALDAQHSRAVTERLEALAREEQVAIRYAGVAEKTAWCREASRLSGVPIELLHLAVFGIPGSDFAAGANRNSLLLDAVGRRCMSVDDDMLGELGQAPDRGEHLRFSEDEPTEFWFFRDADRLRAEACSHHDDLLAAHEKLLGRGLTSCVSGFPAVDLESIAAYFRGPIETRRGRVRITVSGVLGDCGLTDALPYLTKAGATLGRLLGQGDDYLANRATRQVLRVVRDATITRRPFCMTGAVGLDHTRTLPPFLPIGRGEDGLFSMLLRVCEPNDFIGLLPIAVRHDPPDVRGLDPERIRAGTLPLTHAIALCVTSLFTEHLQLDAPARMRLLGRCLIELSALPWPELREVMRLQLARSLARRITLCEALLRSHPNGHSQWRRDLESHIGSALGMLRDVDTLQPIDLPRDATEHAPLDRPAAFQLVLRRFGELLEAWPAIVVAARTMAHAGVRLAQPIRSPSILCKSTN